MTARLSAAAAILAGAIAVPMAAPANAWTADVIANVDLTSTIKKLNQTTTFPRGQFTGVLDSDARTIVGKTAIPPATSQLKIGSLPLADVTIKIIPQGTSRTDISFDGWDWALHTTQTVGLQIVSLKPPGMPINMVGNYGKSTPSPRRSTVASPPRGPARGRPTTIGRRAPIRSRGSATAASSPPTSSIWPSPAPATWRACTSRADAPPIRGGRGPNPRGWSSRCGRPSPHTLHQ